MTALADRRTLLLARSIVATKEWPERPPTKAAVSQRAKVISQDELLSTHRHGSLNHHNPLLERHLRTRGKSAKSPRDVKIDYPPLRLPDRKEETIEDEILASLVPGPDLVAGGMAAPDALPTGPPVMVISERLLTKPTWIMRTEKFWWCGGVHKCAPRRRAPAHLRPTVYGFHSKKHVFGSAPTLSKVNVYDRPTGTPPFKMAPPPTVGTSRRDVHGRGSDKKTGIRPVPESVSVLRPWLTETIPQDASGVESKDCLIFLPCLTHPSFFNIAHPFKDIPYIPPAQGVDADLAFKGILTPESVSPLPAEALPPGVSPVAVDQVVTFERNQSNQP